MAIKATERGFKAMLNDHDTEEGAKFADGGFHDTSKPIGSLVHGATREMQPPDYSSTSVTDRVRKRYNVPEGASPAWIRREDWAGRRDDRPGEFLDTNEGSAIALDNEGKPCRNGDYILAYRPQELVDALNERLNANAREFMEKAPKQNPTYTEDEMMEMRDDSREMLQHLLHNSPTSGKDFDTACQIMSPDDTERIADRYRWNGRTRPVQTPEPVGAQIANAKDRVVEGIKGAMKGKAGSFSMGVGFDKSGKIVR